MNRMQQPAQQTMNAPLSLVSTEQIQKADSLGGKFPPKFMNIEYLDENKNLIMAILECQKMGKVAECAQYQAILQKNLMYLAAIADAQPPGSTTPSQLQTSVGAQHTQPSTGVAKLQQHIHFNTQQNSAFPGE